MLCKCSGKYIDIYFILKITYILTVYTYSRAAGGGGVEGGSEGAHECLAAQGPRHP